MQRKRLVTASILLALAGSALGGRFFRSDSQAETVVGPPAPLGAAAGEKFVVHEWGTFTSFSGSDGVKLEFRPLVDADLPPFVLNRPLQAGDYTPFSKAAYPVLARMETPVTYFYTDRPRSVNVRVDFPKGLLTEFFPPVAVMKPAYTAGALEKIGDSSLDWGRIWVVPEKSFQPVIGDPALAARMQERMVPRLPLTSDAFPHYAYARKTDSALVYTERAFDPKLPYAPAGGWFEKFLFYRGIGNFDLPLKLTALSDGRFDLANTGPHAIRSLFLVTVDDQKLRFSTYEEIAPGARLALRQSEQATTLDLLASSVQTALVRAGLYEKEALAMVNTWRTSWFGEPGTRLFYLLPAQLTDELLPLTIDPPPQERLRVMVGRLEIMSPEEELRITELVRQSAEDRADGAKAAAPGSQPPPVPEAIKNLGRLAEPALVRVANVAHEPVVRREATILLGELRTQRP